MGKLLLEKQNKNDTLIWPAITTNTNMLVLYVKRLLHVDIH